METLRFLMATSYYPPNHLGGDAMHVKYLAELLAASGHEVTIVCSESAAKRKGVLRGQSSPPPGGDVIAVSSRMPRLEIGLAYLANWGGKMGRVLERVARTTKPDVVHYHNVAAIGWHGIRGAWRTLYTAHDYWAICQRGDLLKYGKRLCQTPNCVTCSLGSGRPPQLWRYPEATAGLKFVPDVVLAPSFFLASQFGLRFPQIASRIVVCPNFVPDMGVTSRARTQHLLYVGVLSRPKGVRDLVLAVASQTSLHLHVVGEGAERRYLRKIISRWDAGNRITLHGTVTRDELIKLYQSARAVVIPSLWPENAPLVALESLSTGTPVLASRNGGLPEIVDSISPELCLRPPDLLAALGKLRWAEDLGRVCRHLWEERYSPEAFLQRYSSLLQGTQGS